MADTAIQPLFKKQEPDCCEKLIFYKNQIGYLQSASLLTHNLIATIAAFQWEFVLPLKQGSPTAFALAA